LRQLDDPQLPYSEFVVIFPKHEFDIEKLSNDTLKVGITRKCEVRSTLVL
jgi:hypothetical protein